MRQEWVIDKQKLICNDCVSEMQNMAEKSTDVVVTSPPYNLDVSKAVKNFKNHVYEDNLKEEDYWSWFRTVVNNIKRILKDDGSFFINVSGNCKHPYFSMDACQIIRNEGFVLQNNIVWIKSITIEDDSYGHFKPVKGNRFLNKQHESIFHFTKSGDVNLDRLAVGVPYADKLNVTRWKNKKDIRCGGNVWFLPYRTYSPQSDRDWKARKHPAGFPVSLPERCIKLHGINENMVVCDPFLGIGTTLVACQNLGVNGVGIEIDFLYCELGLKLLNKT